MVFADKCFLLLLLQEYIHRVGRTARGEGGQGHALLILRPEELGFLRYLRQAKIALAELEFSWAKISNIQPQVSSCMRVRSITPYGSQLNQLIPHQQSISAAILR